MGAFDKFKDGISKFINVADSEYEDYDPADDATEKEDKRTPVKDWSSEPEYSKVKSQRSERAERKQNVVSIDGSRNPAVRSLGDSQVVVKKVSGVSEVGSVADILKQGRIVVLNLEECPADAIQRVIDILYGVTYAIDGSFNPIAEKAFVITPYNVSVSSEEYSEIGETENY